MKNLYISNACIYLFLSDFDGNDYGKSTVYCRINRFTFTEEKAYNDKSVSNVPDCLHCGFMMSV